MSEKSAKTYSSPVSNRTRYELPRWFTEFPERDTCPICRTNYDGATILVPIEGTSNDGIAEAIPVHLVCALPKNFIPYISLLYRRPNP